MFLVEEEFKLLLLSDNGSGVLLSIVVVVDVKFLIDFCLKIKRKIDEEVATKALLLKKCFKK